MLTTQELQSVTGRSAFSPEGEKIGRIGHVFVDELTAEPEFVSVHTGLFGLQENFVPLREATVTGERVTVPFSKDTVKDSPAVDVDHGHIRPEDEKRIFDYYGLSSGAVPEDGRTRLQRYGDLGAGRLDQS